jgi:two-component system, chemotaxis family, sensor kinase Cph1
VSANPSLTIAMTRLDLIAQVKQSIATLTDPELVTSGVELTNCDREPIQIPNAIQAHGILITFTETDLTILQVSQNCQAFLGMKLGDLLGKSLAVVMSQQTLVTIRGCIDTDFEHVNPLRLSLQVQGESRGFEGIVYRSDGVIVLELEAISTNDLPQQSTAILASDALAQMLRQGHAVDFFDFYKFVKTPLGRIQNTQTLAELATQTVTTIRNLTGFDRVMLYRFDDDGAGHVIAENKLEGTASFVGLRYPASDIPKQAKELYRINLLRIIPDIFYEPVLLEPTLNPMTGAPLDLSLSMLRSVSPMHTEYLSNFGVRASMSISVLRERQLWGLIACHHYTPRQLSYETRTICEFLGQVISVEIGSKVDAEDLDYQLQIQAAQVRFVETIVNCQNLMAGFTQNPQDLCEIVGATGVVFCELDRIACFGKTPPDTAIPDLLTWVDTQIGENAIYSTNLLVSEYPPLMPSKDIASGLLALRVSQIHRTYLLWFRPEVIQTIEWGGEPNKPVESEEDHQLRMTPRKSFERWKQTVQLRSLPWKVYEIEAALALRVEITGIVLQKADELAILNAELERSNIELDSFAYVASHDLKEPLRGIHNYSTFLIEDYGDKLGTDGHHKLTTLMRLTQRMENTIDSLLHYSRLGRAELVRQPVDLNEIVENAIETIEISQPSPVQFHIPRLLPIVTGDRHQITEVFTNLISNGIKYHDLDHKSIEIGYVLPTESDERIPATLNRSQTVFFIADNGIGILPKHFENIFKIFKRLHPATKYGGGTGAGLTIVKKIVERHGGKIAVVSVLGEGSTFYFTLGANA